MSIITFLSKAGDFYYYKNNKIQLEYNYQYFFVLVRTNDKEDLQKVLGSDIIITKFLPENGATGLIRNNKLELKNHFWAEAKFDHPLSEEHYNKFLSDLKNNNKIEHVSAYYNNKLSNKIGVSNYISIKLKSKDDYLLLEQHANELKLSIEGQNKFMPLWYSLSCNKNSTYDALHAANYLFETNSFAAAEPDLMTDDNMDCVNDTFFNNQWGLLNATTPTSDINACDAWNISTGSNSIIVAVLDQGVQMTHPDLQANIFGLGYDTESGISPSQVLGDHGTACAGIVAALQNNSIGISGVAPNCKLMSVSNSLAGTTNSRVKRADGINWAYLNGADVISNSWGSPTQHQVIDDAIEFALVFGRGALGTCVVFATGNDNLSSAEYPANSNPNIIAVGAISPCGERKSPTSCDGELWGSNYGTSLDVVAPGVLIPTTDRTGSNGYNSATGNDGDYTQTFNGTSSATPHVAGLCALIISVKPCLSNMQVIQIIERSAQKVGVYSYATTAGRPNGTWNNEMGYGLVNAEASVIMAGSKYLQNMTNTGFITYKSPFIQAGYSVNPFLPLGDYVTTSSANVTIQSSFYIDFQPGCDLRGKVDAQITSIGACSTW